ncbi:MAG TPA: FtsX-like permease family protein [Bryobacteraceae bacterium]|nr:FtsX-like permease family protein [Bryobacteraceae bacterium]
MAARFETFVARRYLRAKRKEAVVSIVTAISVVGVAAGVMALIIALAVNNGFSNELQKNLLRGTAHIDVTEKIPGYGIENWAELISKLRNLSHVTGVAPALYGEVFLQGPLRSKGAVLKGVDVRLELQINDILSHLKAGPFDRLNAASVPPGIVLGAELARDTGMMPDSIITVISTELTPFGPHAITRRFRVVGIFESGFYQYDDLWAYTALPAAQQALSLGDVVNEIEIKLDDPNLAPEMTQKVQEIVGTKLLATNWIAQNGALFNAFRMEKAVTFVTIGLILLVAALNILISLVMMVMEKYRDIAVLMSMGARRNQIRKIFMLQGVLIGLTGTAIGVVVAYTLCHFADRYRWIRLDSQVYALSYVPFEPRLVDGIWVAAGAILISFLATIYPARNASKLTPTEVLRYE